jgi:ribosome biogenesis protein BMS1
VPPVIVAVMGPSGVRYLASESLRQVLQLTSSRLPFPQVGKTTLIRSLVRRYTKNTMVDIKGPVTIVSGESESSS